MELIFEYKGKEYIIMELVSPLDCGSYDILQVMEIKPDEDGTRIYRFINYYYGASLYDQEEAIKIAIEYIEME